MRTHLAVVWLSFLSGCSSGGGDNLFRAPPATGTGGTGTSGTGGSSGSGAGGTGSQSGGATAAGGSDAGGGGAVGAGGVTGAGGVMGSGGASGSGGADASSGATGSGGAGDGGPATGGDAGCSLTGCTCPAACECDNRGGHSYAFCATLRTWASASAACVSVGARLVRVDDASENGWLLGRAPTAGVTTTNGMWLGASDAATEGAWRWEDGDTFWDDTVSAGAGAPVGGLYSNWHGPTPPFAAAEPNNTGGVLSGGEDCGMMRSDGTWNDGSCSTTAGYVCEVY